MPRRVSRSLLWILAALSLAASGPAFGQAQPLPVYQAKGGTITVADSITHASSTTPALDMSGFTDLLIHVVFNTIPNGATCVPYVAVYVADAAAGPYRVESTLMNSHMQFYVTGSDPHGYTYAIGSLPNFIKIKADSSNGDPCTISVYATPTPFPSTVSTVGPLPEGWSTIPDNTAASYPVIVGGVYRVNPTDKGGIIKSMRLGPTGELIVADLGGTVECAGHQTLVLATSTAVPGVGTMSLALSQRRTIEIQNLGPDPIFCACDGSDPVVNVGRRIASLGTWTLDCSDTACPCKCITTAPQVSGAATITTEIR